LYVFSLCFLKINQSINHRVRTTSQIISEREDNDDKKKKEKLQNCSFAFLQLVKSSTCIWGLSSYLETKRAATDGMSFRESSTQVKGIIIWLVN